VESCLQARYWPARDWKRRSNRHNEMSPFLCRAKRHAFLHQLLSPMTRPIGVRSRWPKGSTVFIIVGAILIAAGVAFAGVAVVRGADDGANKSAAGDALGTGPHAGNPHPVAGNFKPDETRISDCQSDQRCFEQAMGNLVYGEGPGAAFHVFDRKVNSDAVFASGCHRIVHIMGSAALTRYEGNVGKAFAEGSASCASGYYHGILEHAFAQARDLSVDGLGEVARGLCAGDDLGRSTYLTFQCIHGLGHGLMIRSGYNLEFSLSVCDELATAWDRRSCHGGAFMENFSSSYGVKSQWLKDDDLIYPCNAVPESQKEGCYLIVTARILEVNGFNWEAAARTCWQSDRRWIDTCLQSYGRDAAGFSVFDQGRIVELCALAGSGEAACYYGATRAIANNFMGVRPAAALCDAAPARSRPRCFYGVGTYVYMLHGAVEEERRVCERLSGRYADVCMDGARDTAELRPPS
jgi:hypothetical protein